MLPVTQGPGCRRCLRGCLLRWPCRAMLCRAAAELGAWGTPEVTLLAPCHQHSALLQVSGHPEVSIHPLGGVLCTPRPWCTPPGGFPCTPRPRCIPPGGVLCTPRSQCIPPGVSVHHKNSVHPPRGVLCTPRTQCIPWGGFCAPRNLGASPPRGVLCTPRLGALPGAPRVTVHFIYGVTYVIVSIFLTFPEKR